MLRLLACLLLTACTTTLYEPAICVEEHADTVGMVLDEQDQITDYLVRPGCDVWQAMSDSTKRWDNDGRRLP